VTESDYSQIIGLSVEAAWDWVRERFSLTESPTIFYRAYNDAVLELMKQPREPLPGVADLLTQLKVRGIPVGLASASLRQWVDTTLDGLGLNGAFATTVTASEVEQSKPAPDLDVKAAKRLAWFLGAGRADGGKRPRPDHCAPAGQRRSDSRYTGSIRGSIGLVHIHQIRTGAPTISGHGSGAVPVRAGTAVWRIRGAPAVAA